MIELRRLLRPRRRARLRSAARAAAAFEPSGPPACAISGRPPPPLPPEASAPLRTRSTALKRATRSLVTPTTMPALPSSVTPTMATTPEPTFFLPSSARLRRSFRSMPSTARAMSLMSPTARTPSAPSALAAAAHGEPFLRLGQLALDALALVKQRGDAGRHFVDRHAQFGRRRLWQGAQDDWRWRAPPARSAPRYGARRSRPRIRRSPK